MGRGAVHRISSGFVFLGLLALLWVAYQLGDSWLYQRRAARELEARLKVVSPAPPDSAPGTPSIPPADAPARLEIPRIGVSCMIVPGEDAFGLRLGVVHINGTAALGEPGNVGLAAHRDTYFRNLQEVAAGDTIFVRTIAGDLRYVVTWIQILQPSQTAVLDPTPTPALTLVTCYPFHYVGHAPKRFVVRAQQLDSPPPLRSIGTRPKAGPARRLAPNDFREDTRFVAGRAVATSPSPP